MICLRTDTGYFSHAPRNLEGIILLLKVGFRYQKLHTVGQTKVCNWNV